MWRPEFVWLFFLSEHCFIAVPLSEQDGKNGLGAVWRSVATRQWVCVFSSALAGLPDCLTLDAYGHGMTELGDAELAAKGMMALSGDRTPRAARLYLKRRMAVCMPS